MAGMEIKIIEVPSTSKSASTPPATYQEIKAEKAADLQKSAGKSKSFDYSNIFNFKGKLQDKIKEAMDKKTSQQINLKSTAQSVGNGLGLNPGGGGGTSKGQSGESGNSSSSSSSSAGKAMGIMMAAQMGADFLLNVADTVFTNATLGKSWGKYGGNQVAARKANNIVNTVKGVADIAGTSFQASQAGFLIGGPIGAVVGGIAGIALGVANQALENSKAAKELAMKQSIWADEASKNLERLGYNGGR